MRARLLARPCPLSLSSALSLALLAERKRQPWPPSGSSSATAVSSTRSLPMLDHRHHPPASLLSMPCTRSPSFFAPGAAGAACRSGLYALA
jgi:hypothetical protein